jgi:hypothetical protein
LPAGQTPVWRQSPVVTQAPLEQAWLAAHGALHEPQFSGSVLASTQLGPQEI